MANEERQIDKEITTLEQQLENAGQVSEVQQEAPVTVDDKVSTEEIPAPAPAAAATTDGKGQPAPVTAPEDHDDEFDLKGKNPTPSDWDKVRNKVRELKTALKAKDVPTSAATPVAAAAESPKPADDAKPKLDSGDIFSVYVDAQSGSKFEKEKGRQLLSQAQNLIDEMPAAEILSVIKRAKKGDFGDNSADVLIVAKDALIEANAREAIEYRTSQEQSVTKAKWQEDVQHSSKRISEKFPIIVDTKNLHFTEFAKKWRTQFIGEMDSKGNLVKPGPLVGLIGASPSWPEVIGEMLVNAYVASGGKLTSNTTPAGKPTPASTGAENAEPQTVKVAEYVPEGGSNAPVSGPAGAGVQDIERKLAGLGTVGRR